ncbi:hypothetical protein L249_4017 [Ophiocordyceps polyrhachis-furcata BCC 54312]|uniref:WSC domain-containing protein n=1 Tax=Ophiocordyceps polyrhachis-furcata BCC 54312 TaxID=1330021 RepID=A0A367L5X4_9HYPO|nr:hypothetical protein L249_4017 [Ophiocordyceps polyrhachis-furcata BCC 54312]
MAALSIGLLLLAWLAFVRALDPDLCASLNTADTPQNVSIYQTNGLCHDHCMKSKRAYAITQGNSCWCSDYTPAQGTQVDKSKCDRTCPGYPEENCGGKGLFGYVPLNVSPAGTKGASKSDEPSSTSASSSTSAEDGTAVTETPSSMSSSSSVLPTSVIQTVTADGKVQTVTVVQPTQTPQANETKEAPQIRLEQTGLGKGAVVGLVIGIIAAAAATAAMGLYLWMQRKKRREQNLMDDPSVRGSSSGILGGRPEMSAIPGSPESTGNRSSTLQIDPRMDPFKQGLYARSGSHESINTLRDEHDYSRRIQQPKVLRAMNPDPVAADD